MTDQLQHMSELIIDGSLHDFGSMQTIRSSTITETLFGIHHLMQAARESFPIDLPQIRTLLRGVVRLDSPCRQSSPASGALLETCFHTLALNDPVDQDLWGVLGLVFNFLVQRSELGPTRAQPLDDSRSRATILS